MTFTRFAIATLLGIVSVTALAVPKDDSLQPCSAPGTRCTRTRRARGSVQRGLSASHAADAHETQSGRQHCAGSQLSNALSAGLQRSRQAAALGVAESSRLPPIPSLGRLIHTEPLSGNALP
jgi:hypothetical protein